jgi:hypothetical protein
MSAPKRLTFEEASALFAYDPETGALTWRVRRTRIAPGAVAGGVKTAGYRHVRACNAIYLAHRLCWLLHYGEWPLGMVDHINGLRDDNRIANLRLATPAINSQNRRLGANNRLGVLGVHQVSSRRFRAQIRVAGRKVWLGDFPTADMAHDAYLAAKRQFHEGNTL